MIRSQQDMPRLLAAAQDEERNGKRKEAERRILEPDPVILFTRNKRFIWIESAK